MSNTSTSRQRPERHSRDPLVGSQLDGDFEVLRGIGSGSHADVFLATQASVGGRHVAVKVLCRPYLQLKEADLRRARNGLLREGKLMGALRSPCFAEVYRTGDTADGRPYIAMEYVHGNTLGDEKSKSLSPFETVGIVRQLADGLAELAALGYVHRDITPANILLRPGPGGRLQVKLIDLGTATKVSDRPDKYRVGYDLEHPLGTPAYMAPEQARGDLVDPRADQFAVAACMYELLTGERAFSTEGHGARALLQRLKSNEPIPERPASSIAQGVAEGACQTLDRALSIAPEERYESITDFADAFAAGMRGAAPPKRPLWQRIWGQRGGA